MIIFLGDTHGEWEMVFQIIKRNDISNCHLIHVGDIGVGFYGQSDKKIRRGFGIYNQFFRGRNIIFQGVAGNHDNPAYFDGSVDLSHFKLIRNYSYRDICGQRILFVGGAISIDRKSRKLNYSYWENEAIQPAPDNLQPADIIVAHDAPLWAGKDASSLYDTPDDPVKTDAIAGRTILGNVVKQVKPKLYVHGHYHASSSFFFEGVKYRGLDINELWSCFY